MSNEPTIETNPRTWAHKDRPPDDRITLPMPRHLVGYIVHLDDIGFWQANSAWTTRQKLEVQAWLSQARQTLNETEAAE